MTQHQLGASAREYREIQAEIKELQERLDTLKVAMIGEMDAQGVEILQAGSHTIHYSLYESTRLDSSRIKKERPDLYNAYGKTVVSTRFQVA